jgi:hypothetical protein
LTICGPAGNQSDKRGIRLPVDAGRPAKSYVIT